MVTVRPRMRIQLFLLAVVAIMPVHAQICAATGSPCTPTNPGSTVPAVIMFDGVTLRMPEHMLELPNRTWRVFMHHWVQHGNMPGIAFLLA